MFTRKYIHSTIILTVFFISIYLGLQINFFNNDDWVHYKTLENFLNGNFVLHPYIGSTFFTQGLLGYAHAKFFGISTIPVLTLVISVINIFILIAILNQSKTKNYFLKFLAVSLFVLNPLYLYSSIGFMTENYVLLFILLSIYFISQYFRNRKISDILASNIFMVLGFFAKQYSILLGLSTIVYLAIKKQWKTLLIVGAIQTTLILFYVFLFPKSEILNGQAINPLKLLDTNSTISLGFNIFLYLSFFTIPLSIIWAFSLKKFKLASLILFIVVLFIQLKFLDVSEFPYLPNVLTRKGLFPDIEGNKSHWAGYHKFFNYMFYISITTSSLVITKLILNAKRIFNENKFLTLSFLSFFGFSLVLPNFYDRYLLPLLVIWILLMYKSLKRPTNSLILKLVCFAWLTIYAFFGYLFLSDFVIRNHEIEKETQILIDKGVNKNEIIANRAWNSYHEIDQSQIKYIFSYDNPEVFDNFKNSQLEKIIYVNFLFNLFVSNEIYLYRIENEIP